MLFRSKLIQPYSVEIGGRTFCLGHGDGLGPGNKGYKLMRWGFHNPVLQWLFSLLHPWLAFRLGKGWSKRSRLAKNVEYDFRGSDEPLWKFAEDYSVAHKVDEFIFGHYHCKVDATLSAGAGFHLLKDWMDGSDALVYDSVAGTLSRISS